MPCAFKSAMQSSDTATVVPRAEVMLAATLALMTGHAQSVGGPYRQLMAKKVVSNLFFLSAHPQLSPQFKTMLGNLHAHWRALAQVSLQEAVPHSESSIRHAGTTMVQ